MERYKIMVKLITRNKSSWPLKWLRNTSTNAVSEHTFAVYFCICKVHPLAVTGEKLYFSSLHCVLQYACGQHAGQKGITSLKSAGPSSGSSIYEKV